MIRLHQKHGPSLAPKAPRCSELFGATRPAATPFGPIAAQGQLGDVGVGRLLKGHVFQAVALPTGSTARAPATPLAWSTSASSAAAVIVGDELPQGIEDLSSLCTLQLGFLYQMLSRVGVNFQSLHATVYVRCVSMPSSEQNNLQLLRVATFPQPPEVGLSREFTDPGTLLLNVGRQEGIGGGSQTALEEALVAEEFVALPQTGALVFPLTDNGLLVGILVIDSPQQSQWSKPAAGTEAAALGSAAALPAPTDPQHSSSVSVHHISRLEEDELHYLRLSVPLLAKACGMHVRAAMQVAASRAQAASARTLLQQVRRPLTTLNTFGSMLVPRLKEGDADRDMAKGIMLQGKRLQDLLWQLESALHPAAMQAPQPELQLGLLPMRISAASSALASASQELMRLPEPMAPAVTTGAAGTQPYVARGGRTSASASGQPHAAATHWRSSASVSPASASAASPSHSPSARPAMNTPEHEHEAVQGVPVSAGYTARRASASYPAMAAATSTIDMEISSSGTEAVMRERAGRKQVVRQPAPYSGPAVNIIGAIGHILSSCWKMAQALGVEFIVSSPLLLPASAGGRSGIKTTAYGRRPGPGSVHGRLGARRPKQLPSSCSGGGEGESVADVDDLPQLLPRPPRPLLVAARTPLVQKLVASVLDIALQCTPRGGQVCVSARQDGSGVQVAVLHTGRIDPARLHAPSAMMQTYAQDQVQVQVPEDTTAPKLAATPAAAGNTLTAAGASPVSPGSSVGSSRAGHMALLSVELAQELARQAGGHLTIKHPCNMINAGTGLLDLGTSLEVWLPGPTPAR